jgi:hypothetical protein
MTIGEREEDAAKREAEHAIGNDRTKTPPVSDRPVEEPTEMPRPDLEAPSPQE